MPESLTELPLFPLETVLFPDGALQLHIFEDRYREMVRGCIENGSSFGIVLVRPRASASEPPEPYMVGTTVRIEDVHTYPDGRLDVRVHGDERFRIRKLDDTQAYLVGFVEPVLESPPSSSERLEDLTAEARTYFQTFIEGIIGQQDQVFRVVCPEDPVALSFKIANMLQIENLEKQRLLETVDTVERFEALVPILREHLEDIGEYADLYRTSAAIRVYQVTPEDLRDWSGPN
jgi:Lon protease-like protein